MTTGAVFDDQYVSSQGDELLLQLIQLMLYHFLIQLICLVRTEIIALDGATIRANGSGSGSTGGFDVGGNYLAFQGFPFGDSFSRMALLKPMDATNVDTLTITAIRGTGSNGGEHPDISRE